MSSIGIMEGAFFVGRKEVMDWVNTTLDLNLAKVEDTASGAVACQMLDIMYPGQVPMHKVNWSAKQDFEFVANYKILQTAFSKLNIEKHIDVDRLISGRYMDNLEFMQWFKKFFELSGAKPDSYDAVGIRSKGKGGATYGGKKSGVSKPATSSTAAKKQSTAAANLPTAPPAQKKTSAVKTIQQQQENAAPSNSNVNKTVASSGDVPKADAAVLQELAHLKAAAEQSNHAYGELRLEMEGLEKERDFYFEKLRDIEVMLQEVEDKGEGTALTANIFKILYATIDGFEPVDGAAGGNVSTGPAAESASVETF